MQMQRWLKITLEQMLRDIYNYDHSFKSKDADKFVNKIFTDYFKMNMYKDSDFFEMKDCCMKNILANAYQASKDQHNMLILSLTAQILMQKRFSINIDYRGIIENAKYVDTRKDFTIWVSDFISYH